MADIYARQDHCDELLELWANPPLALKTVMRTYRDELLNLTTRLLRRYEKWLLLQQHCLSVIEETISQLNLVENSNSLWELCAWRSDVWEGLLTATTKLTPGEE